MKVGDKVTLAPFPGAPPNGPHALDVEGTVLEVSGPVAFLRWTNSLTPGHLARCGVGGGWHKVSELQVQPEEDEPEAVCPEDLYAPPIREGL